MWPIQRVALKCAFFLPLTPVRRTVPISSRLPTSAGGHRATTLERSFAAGVHDQANAPVILALQRRNPGGFAGCAARMLGTAFIECSLANTHDPLKWP